jgi:hypothetical protein
MWVFLSQTFKTTLTPNNDPLILDISTWGSLGTVGGVGTSISTQCSALLAVYIMVLRTPHSEARWCGPGARIVLATLLVYITEFANW